jgi:hypothetical protein
LDRIRHPVKSSVAEAFTPRSSGSGREQLSFAIVVECFHFDPDLGGATYQPANSIEPRRPNYRTTAFYPNKSKMLENEGRHLTNQK